MTVAIWAKPRDNQAEEDALKAWSHAISIVSGLCDQAAAAFLAQ